jgi:hypothetical protein
VKSLGNHSTAQLELQRAKLILLKKKDVRSLGRSVPRASLLELLLCTLRRWAASRYLPVSFDSLVSLENSSVAFYDSYLSLLPPSCSVTWLENSCLALCNGRLASWYVPTLLCSVTWLENSCLAFCDDGRASWYLPTLHSLRSDSQVLVLSVPPGSTNLSNLFATAWNAYFTAFFYSFIVDQISHEEMKCRLILLQRAPSLCILGVICLQFQNFLGDEQSGGNHDMTLNCIHTNTMCA